MIEKLREDVKKRVTEKRYIHILGVEEKAVELAKKCGIDEEKTRIAAILHDIAKNLDLETQQKICKEYFSDELCEKDMEINEILHGFVGCIIANKELGIDDLEILDAIKYHTIGKKDFGMLGKIIYISDSIEKNRDYPDVVKIREIVDKDLEKGIVYEIERKAVYLEKIGCKIHKNTLEMREQLMENIKNREKR